MPAACSRTRTPAWPPCLTPRRTRPTPPRQAGANDYVTKPFGQKELVARIQAQLRTREFSQGCRIAAAAAAAAGAAGAAAAAAPAAPPAAAGGAGAADAAAGPRQRAGAAPAAGSSGSGGADMQRKVDELQRQLRETQHQLAALAAAAGSPAALAAVQAAVGAAAAPAPASQADPLPAFAPAANGTTIDHSGSSSLDSGSPPRTSAEELPPQPAAAPDSGGMPLSVCRGSATSRDSGASMAAA